MTQYLYIVFFLFTCVTTLAQNAKDERGHHTMMLTGGLSAYGSEPSYNIGIGYSWFPLKYVGASIGVEIQKYMDSKNGFILEDGNKKYEITKDQLEISHFSLTPAVSLRSPILWFKNRNSGITFQCDPGLMLTFPNQHLNVAEHRPEDSMTGTTHLKSFTNHGGKCVFWRIRNLLSFTDGNGQISLGYSLSNFDPFSCHRNMTVGSRKIFQNSPKHNFSHTFFIAFGYNF